MDTTEYLDTESVVADKALKLARLLVSSKRVICFTGAGISTSSGIPDYRSGYNTIISTGPGAWESEENKQKYTKEKHRVETLRAIPSKTHMALYELVSRGYIHHIITQNVDGLHRKSGIPEDKLTELHGGTNKEICKECRSEYLRDFLVRNYENPESEHKTLRKCTNCGSDLYDTIVYFHQPLRMVDKVRAQVEAENADCCLVLGSSLKVAPASRYPLKFIDNPEKKLAIVNLQKTNLDRKSHLRIGALTDHVMELVMSKIGIPIPEYKVKRWMGFQISPSFQDSSFSILKIKNYNREMLEFSVFKSIEIEANIDNSTTVVELHEEPFEFKFTGRLISLKCHLKFFGHKDEKNLEISAEDWGPLWESLVKGREIIIHGEFCLNEKNWDLLEARAL